MNEEEPRCDYCGEKAVKRVHSFADKMELQQTTIIVNYMIESTIFREKQRHNGIR
jgi:hypothetical protein